MGCYAFMPAIILLEGRLPLLRHIVLYMNVLWIAFWLWWAARAYKNPKLRKTAQGAAGILFIFVSIAVGVGLAKELLDYLLLR